MRQERERMGWGEKRRGKGVELWGPRARLRDLEIDFATEEGRRTSLAR